MAEAGGRGWTLRVKGVLEAQARIRNMTAQFGDALPTVFVRGGTIIQTAAQQKLDDKDHVLTGALQRSINTQLTDWAPEMVRVSIGTWLAYAAFIENLPDGGYMFESFDEERADVLRYISSQLEAVIRRSL